VAVHTTEAIVLRTLDYSETSLIVWLFSRTHGRLHVIAKGARRPRSVFEGALEPLVRGELSFYRKQGKVTGLDTAKEFDPLDRHTGLRRELPRLYSGLYLAELLIELSEEDAPAPDAFEAAAAGLADLTRAPGEALDAILLRTELALVRSAGLAPCLTWCAACGPSAGQVGEPWFSAPAGGVLCATHAGRDPAARQVSFGALSAFAELAAGQPIPVGKDVAGELRDLLDRFLYHHLGKRLRLQPYLRSAREPRPEPARTR